MTKPDDTTPGLTPPAPSGLDPRVLEGLRDVDAGRVLPVDVVRLLFDLEGLLEETPGPIRVRRLVIELLGWVNG